MRVHLNVFFANVKDDDILEVSISADISEKLELIQFFRIFSSFQWAISLRQKFQKSTKWAHWQYLWSRTGKWNKNWENSYFPHVLVPAQTCHRKKRLFTNSALIFSFKWIFAAWFGHFFGWSHIRALFLAFPLAQVVWNRLCEYTLTSSLQMWKMRYSRVSISADISEKLELIQFFRILAVFSGQYLCDKNSKKSTKWAHWQYLWSRTGKWNKNWENSYFPRAGTCSNLPPQKTLVHQFCPNFLI